MTGSWILESQKKKNLYAVFLNDQMNFQVALRHLIGLIFSYIGSVFQCCSFVNIFK